MNLESTLKDEVFRPLATTIVPGTLSLGPYILIAACYISRLPGWWDAHPNSFTAIVAILAISCGLLCEDIGSEIEVRWLDKKMERYDSKFKERWQKYLQLTLSDERVGKTYLKSLLLRFKFELAMIPAILSLTVGLTWLNAICEYLPWTNFVFVALFFIAVTAFLCWEVNQGAVVLDDVRKQLLAQDDNVADVSSGARRL